VKELSKQYKLGNEHRMLREVITGMLKLDFLRKKKEQESLWALRNVSLSIQRGETVGLIGSNGAGKSTLLKILSRITYPTSGSYGISGRVISLLEVGTGFHDELTGRENVYLNASIMGMPKKEVHRRFDAIVEYSGVEKFIDTPIKRYSTGMRLRLGFAVAAHLEPDILIVDEVLAVGDAAFQKKCLDTIHHLRATARTILFVSHSLYAVENICDRCIWIDAGQIRMDDEARKVIREYLASLQPPKPETAVLQGEDSRRGNGKLRYTRVEFVAPDGSPQKITRAGDPIIIRLHYQAQEAIPYPSLGIRMYTEANLLISETGTWHHGIYIESLQPGAGYFDVEIDCLNLLPGNYALSLWATDMQSALVYDQIEHAATLKVQPGNIYNSGREIDNGFGIVFFPQKWNLSGAPGAANETAGQLTGQLERMPK
jgi:lipopolysaccharide transport system ATP-binding protein